MNHDKTQADCCDNEACAKCCLHEESENGICNDCGAEIDWISRTFQDDMER